MFQSLKNVGDVTLRALGFKFQELFLSAADIKKLDITLVKEAK
jgi:hypothetical protein